MRLAILVSGRGSNLAAVLEAVADGRLQAVQPVLVVSNRPAVGALEVAVRHGVRSTVLRRADFPHAAARDAAIGSAVAASGANLALLAGYDQLLGPAYFAAFGGRSINIHPSLLPRHGGAGMMGLAVHRSVLAAGDPETGVTIHEVSAELDAGRPLAQASVPVLPGDDPQALADRVLQLEHELVVTVLARLAAEAESATSSVSMAAALPPAIGARATHERR